MKKMSEKTVPEVHSCQAVGCVYNHDGNCTTIGITVGDGKEPYCDTFFEELTKGGIKGIKAKVGACHVAMCIHNERYECSAPGIVVSMTTDHPDCGTFATS